MSDSRFTSVDEMLLRSSLSVKWTDHGPDVLPAWIADMDFSPPRAVVSALDELVNGGFLGYPGWSYHRHVEAVVSSWLHDRFSMEDDATRVALLTDVVQGMHAAVHVWSKPGDAVLVMTPIYPPFLEVLNEQGRELLDHRMNCVDGLYTFDIERLRAEVAHRRPTMMLLCNPHNPVGRVFTAAELADLGALAVEFDLVVVADEIHSELIFDPAQHIAFETISEEVRARTVTITSASKACNLAALRTAAVVFGTAALKAEFDAVLPFHLLGVVSVPGMRALEVCLTDESVAEWVRSCRSALNERCDQFATALASRVPGAIHRRPEGTYLAWVDLSVVARPLGEGDTVAKQLLEQVQLAVSSGPAFGVGLERFVRVNLATSPEIVDRIVDRIGMWADNQRAG
jgi:cysteine-S-conjugate beta-lyase